MYCYTYKKFILLSVVLILAETAYAAGPVTHAFLANYWLEKCGKHLSSKQQTEFLVGTVYPDIRYPAQLKREATHDTDVSLLVVRDSSSAFDAGKKFHAWVDDVREYFMTPEYTQEIYKPLPARASKGTFLKFIEDEVLIQVLKLGYPELLKKFQNTMLNYYNEERAYGVSAETLQEWHELLTQHFAYSPAEIFNALSKENKPYGVAPAELVNIWAKALPVYSADTVFQEHVRKLLVYFFELMKQCDATATYTFTKKDI